MIPPVRWRRKRRKVISDMTTESQPNQSEAFNKSVSSVPMAMSMMVDSLVNMMQSNLPQTHQNNSLNLGLNQDEY